MDLQTAVAASMLPAARTRIAAAYRHLLNEPQAGVPFLEVLWSLCRGPDSLPPGAARAVQDAAERALADGRRLGIEAVALFDEKYPPLLKCTGDPPPVLWARGRFETLTSPCVAVIGSRAATPYALQVGERIAAELAERGVVVASGLARGVDSAAHRGCLDAGGATVAVQGCGLDRVYPPEHEDLAARIAETGVVLSELAPGAAPLPEHFPLRNRIISGISLAIVVVEASERSGSLITARYALEQGRDVMVVPGSVLSGRNRGSHALLKDGAAVVESADDIVQNLGWAGPPSEAVPATDGAAGEPLLALMELGEAYGLEELSSLSALAGSELLARITDLELRGRIAMTGGRFVRLS
jgi:DNA processing protein